MKWKIPVLLTLVMALLTSGLFLLGRVSAQDLPGFPIIYLGSVTIAGEPAPDGLDISARMDGKEFGPVRTSGGRYVGLTVNGDRDDSGKTISFYLKGIVKADQEDTFTYQSGPRTAKTLNLTFAFIPEPTPTPAPTPTITPTPLPLGPLQVRLQSPGGDTFDLGETFDVEVVIAPEGHRILRGEVTVVFDTRRLSVVDAGVGSLLPKAFDDTRISDGLVRIGIFQVEATSPLQEAGPLAVLTVKVLNNAQAGSTNVTLPGVTVVDHLSQPFVLDVRDVVLTLSLQGIPGDINKDGRVNVVDLAILGAAHGSKVGDSGYDERADLNEEEGEDGKVGPPDVLILAARYGEET